MRPHANDVQRENGQLSNALRERLAQGDLLDLEVLMRYRGVRTLRALESLETNERALLLVRARQLYELLGIFPSNLKKALDRLFGNEAFGAGLFGENGRVLSTNPRPKMDRPAATAAAKNPSGEKCSECGRDWTSKVFKGVMYWHSKVGGKTLCHRCFQQEKK